MIIFPFNVIEFRLIYLKGQVFKTDNPFGHLICKHFSEWLEKSGWPENKVDSYYKPPFFWFEKSGWPEKKSEFAESLF